MSLVVVGASHRTSPLAVRERLAVPEGDMAGELASLVASEGVREAAILSTCNRVECLLEADTDRLGMDAGTSALRRRMGEDPAEGQLFALRGADAVTHVFRVVCSLDSQVLGEAQILGQVRQAFGRAQAAGTCGEFLTELLKRALRLGKLARSETSIGADSVSLSTTAIRAADRATGGLAGSRVVLLGAGRMARLALAYLGEAGCGDVALSSRTLAHATELASSVPGAHAHAVPFPERYDAVARADVVLCATSAPQPVLTLAELARARAGRGERPLVIVDEAVPRDAEPGCGDLPGVTLIDQERLGSLVDEGLESRLRARPEVERLVSEATQGYLAWLQERMVTPTIRGMYEKGGQILAGELGRATRELERQKGAPLTAEEEAVLGAYGNAIVKKLLHGPVVRLRKESRHADSYYYTGAARYLFGLDTLPPGSRHRCRERPCERGGACPYGLVRVSQVACRPAGPGTGAGGAS